MNESGELEVKDRPDEGKDRNPEKRGSSSSSSSGFASSSASALGLEEIVHIANKVGMEYIEAKQKSDYMALHKASVKARIMLRLEQDQKLSEAKLQRLADVDHEYLLFLDQMSEAKKNAEKLRIRYESYKNLFDARRSLLSYQKAEMKLL